MHKKGSKGALRKIAETLFVLHTAYSYDFQFIFHKSSRRLLLKGQGFSKMSCKGFLLCFLLLWVQKKYSWDLDDYRGLQHVTIDCRRAQHSTKILNVSIYVLVVMKGLRVGVWDDSRSLVIYV